MKEDIYKDLRKMRELIELIKTLRSPNGCPWDQQQKKEDVGKYILEEAYEVIDSIDSGNPLALKEELGDLLFQILFLTEISAESDLFSLENVLEGIQEKMIRRHPHVFDNKKVTSVQEVKENWQKIKAQERKNKENDDSIFSTIPRSLPALKRAQKISSIASHYGFDWKDTEGILDKLNEELQEFCDAVKTGRTEKIMEEMGDIIFTIVNLSRFLSIDAETALSKTTVKFLQRFSYITRQLASQGITPAEATMDQMDTLWNESKTKDIK